MNLRELLESDETSAQAIVIFIVLILIAVLYSDYFRNSIGTFIFLGVLGLFIYLAMKRYSEQGGGGYYLDYPIYATEISEPYPVLFYQQF